MTLYAAFSGSIQHFEALWSVLRPYYALLPSLRLYEALLGSFTPCGVLWRLYGAF